MKYITDRKILKTIYDMYYAEFLKKPSQYYVIIDLPRVASKLNTSVGMLWGRFYYNLNPRCKNDINADLFLGFLGDSSGNKPGIQFPKLESILANELEQRNAHLLSVWISVFAVLVSIISIVVSLSK